MTRDITKSGGGGSLTEAPRLSPELAKLIGKRKIVTSYGDDAGMSSSGAEFRDGVWDQPEWVDQRDRDEAAKALPGFEAMLKPWTHDQIRQQFLLPLWGSTKHQNDASWDAVAIIYPMFLDAMPGWCFRKERLLLAGQHAFSWFPSVQELAAFMEPDRKALLERVAALRKVSESPTQPPKGGAVDIDRSIALERERTDRERREMVETLRQRDLAEGRTPADTSIPPRLSNEGDEPYVRRLVSIMGERISLGARARRADEERYGRAKEMEAEERAGLRRPSPPPTRSQLKTAQDEFRKTHEHGPPLPPGEDTSVCHGERLAGMTADLTTEDEP